MAEGPIGIYIVGTAGCGKSTMAAALKGYLTRIGLDSVLINLDPGALDLPYEPDVDVRDWITLGDVMETYGLGPNGAQVVSADMVALEMHRLKEAIPIDAPYAIVDTPGQMELFAFREASKEVIRSLFPGRSFLIYLVDPANSRTPSGYISQLMLASLSSLRFQIPMVQCISKIDMVQGKDMDRLDRWLGMHDTLLDDAIDEAGAGQDMNPQLAVELFRALENLGLLQGMQKASSADGSGIEQVFRVVKSVFQAGEDLERASEDPEEERRDPQDSDQ
jgi:GTPase SAR1 family protein